MTGSMTLHPDLPLGVQNFAELRQAGMIYVDKTALIYNLVQAKKGFYFLSRPRRFGKTLLLSTFESLFSFGLRDFKDLAIEKLWTEDKTYPVIRLDFSDCIQFRDKNDFLIFFEERLNNAISEAGFTFPKKNNEYETLPSRFERFLVSVRHLNPVLLIDEYDAPFNYCLDKPELLLDVVNTLYRFYAIVKQQSAYLRFFFMTGICKYRELKLFSSGTFIKDLSMASKYATLLGYTQEELLRYFSPYIEQAAKVNHLSFEDCLAKMKLNYDGFCFEKEASSHVHVPWSVLNFLSAPEDGFNNYWYESGGQTEVLLKYIQEHALKKPEDYGKDQLAEYDELKSSMEFGMPNDLALLTHTGYLTIKSKFNDGYAVVNYPNLEVSNSMARLFAKKFFSQNLNTEFLWSFMQDEPPAIVKSLNALLLSVPYHAYPINSEAVLRLLIGFTLTAGGFDVNYESVNALGRSDLEFVCGKRYFVLEFKFARDGDNEKELLQKALEQIKSRHYGEHKHPELEHVRLALVFSSESRQFDEYEVL